MKKTGRKKQLDAYIASMAERQRNLTWPGVRTGGRFVDEFLWKGARDAPMVQRIGAMVLALAYIAMSVVFVSMTFQQGGWPEGIFGIALFGTGGWFIWNALRR